MFTSDKSEQLELDLKNPYTLRLPINAALDLFLEQDWKFTAKSKTTNKCFVRLKDFFSLQGIRYVDEVSEITVSAMRQWLGNEGLSNATINTHHMLVTRMFNFLSTLKRTRDDYRTIVLPITNPGSLIKKAKEERHISDDDAYSKEEVWKFIRAALELGDLGFAELIELRYITGLRPGDAWALTSKNISLNYKLVCGIQHKSITRKNPGGIAYMAALTDEMLTILARRLESTKPGETLFNPKNRIKRWNKIRIRAGMPRAKFYNLRHATTAFLLDNGVDPETIRGIMGWSTTRMLPTYAKRHLGHLREAAAKLGDK